MYIANYEPWKQYFFYLQIEQLLRLKFIAMVENHQWHRERRAGNARQSNSTSRNQARYSLISSSASRPTIWSQYVLQAIKNVTVGRLGNEGTGSRHFTYYKIRSFAYAMCINQCLVSQATPFAERKGLVTLQLTSCPRGTQIITDNTLYLRK